MSDKDVRGLDIEVNDARVVDEMQTLNGERRAKPQKPSQCDGSRHKCAQIQLARPSTARASRKPGTDAKPEADQGQGENHVGRTLLKSAIIFHTRASSSRGNARPYSHRK
jgi:hypothetical protein